MAVRLNNIAEIVAAIPAMLGFVPTESIVALVFAEGRALFTMRHDIAEVSSGRDTKMLAQIIADNGADSAVLVGISANTTDSALGDLAVNLTLRGVTTRHQVHVSTCAHPTTYVDYQTGETGMTGDHRFSALTTATAVENGQMIAATRADFGRMFTTTTEAETVDADTVDREWTAQEMAATVSLNTDPGPELAARFGALIAADVKARDAMIRLGAAELGTAAVVMARTAAHLRGDARANVLTLATLFFYQAGNGAAAGIAIDTVDREHLTAPSLMVLLDRSLRVGVSPKSLPELMPTQEDATRLLGAPFPM